ncbi:MAG: glycoside hydrolase family 5 protein [Lachnospiraceae bacterium]|nr:glycoside hydrolase family 5 protein [Lachnospiraceae bacterium]
MKLFKRSTALLLSALLLCGCGNAAAERTEQEPAVTETEAAEQTPQAEETADPAAASDPAKEAGEPETETAATEEVLSAERDDLKGDDLMSLSAAELVSRMGIGWNLGNTLDAHGISDVTAETFWGNPVTTKEMIDTIASAGFQSIRIPVTFADHMGPAPDYTVDEAWMARVEEVVCYALDNDMYVILDSHHEEEWRIPDNAHIDATDAQLRALWTQIATHFRDYDAHLIFEGQNEPRVVGGANEWNGGTPEGRACINRLNDAFIEAVRATGGNNEKRLLLITSFASSATGAAINDVILPADAHIALSIHAYTPYYFTYDGSDGTFYSTWDSSHRGEIESVFADLQRVFLDKGIPVLITEMGAEDKQGNSADVSAWVTDYLQIAKSHGIPCFWWDNGLFQEGNEYFAIFDRNTLNWYRPEVVGAMMAVYDGEAN